MAKDRVMEALGLEYILHRQFMSYFDKATGPCGSPLEALYDTSSLRLTSLANDTDTILHGGWSRFDVGKPKLVAIYIPGSQSFHVISFTIDAIDDEGITILLYDIFELSDAGAEFFIESHGVPTVKRLGQGQDPADAAAELDKPHGDDGSDAFQSAA